MSDIGRDAARIILSYSWHALAVPPHPGMQAGLPYATSRTMQELACGLWATNSRRSGEKGTTPSDKVLGLYVDGEEPGEAVFVYP